MEPCKKKSRSAVVQSGICSKSTRAASAERDRNAVEVKKKTISARKRNAGEVMRRTLKRPANLVKNSDPLRGSKNIRHIIPITSGRKEWMQKLSELASSADDRPSKW